MNYYNENDPNAAAWLRELIIAGLIPDGDVDERSITEVKAHELTKYTQHHFFVGIGGWPLALRLAGWPEDKPVVTGSCPCQSFSCAGKQTGVKDPRHLWPEMFRLIRDLKPECVLGEQVEAAIGHGWLDGISTDLETEGYASGSVVLGAHSIGAPHRRQRLYWVAVAESQLNRSEHERQGRRIEPSNRRDIDCPECHHRNNPDRGCCWWCNSWLHGATETVGDPESGGGAAQRQDHEQRRAGASGGSGFWSGFDIAHCRDGKARRIPKSESVFQQLADGLSANLDTLRDAGASETEIQEIVQSITGFPLAGKVPGRVSLLKGYGNAIVPQVASEFIKAVLNLELHGSHA